MGILTSPLPVLSVSWLPGGESLYSISPPSHTVQSCLRLKAMEAAYHGLQASESMRQNNLFSFIPPSSGVF